MFLYFQALEEKYSIQKAIVVKMEEELNKNMAVNQSATSPESDRTGNDYDSGLLVD